MRIIVVDDKEEERYLAETLLKGSGYEVVTAVNGAEALEKLRAEDFDMIISDVLMPVMDGFRFCRECREDEKLKDIPFVFYTATYKDERDEELASKVGADKYIRKPIEPEEFVKIIQGLFRDMEEGKIGLKKFVLEEEEEVFKLYSERLIEKLEKKMLDMEAEIAQRKRIQGELQIAEENFRNSMDDSPLGIRVVTAEGELLYANQAILDICGCSSVEELKATPLRKHYTPKSYAEHQERIQRRKLGKPVPSGYEASIVRKDGEIRHVLMSRKAVIWNGEVQFQTIYQDITDRKQAEDEIRESRDYLERLTNSMWDTVFKVRMPERVIEWVNDSYNLIGYGSEECVGSTTEFLYPNKNEFLDFGNKLRNAIDAGENILHSEQLLRRKSGEVFPVDVTATIIRNQEGNVTSVTSIVRDVTERKRVEEELRVKDMAITSSITATAIADLEGNLTYVNHAFLRMWGYDDEKEILGRNAVEFWQVAEEAVEVMQVAMDGGGWIGELVAKRKDGSKFDAQLSASVVRDKAGKPICRFGSFVDITERKQAEQKLKESEEHFRALIENSSDIIQIVDSEGVIRYVSPSVQQVLGYKPEELIGRPSVDVVHPDDLPIVAKGFEKTIQEPGVPVIVECRCKHKDGTWHIIEGIGMNHLDDPSLNGFVSNMHDITERKKAEESIKRAAEEWRTTFDSITDLVFITDKDYKFVRANKAFADVVKMEPEELIGKPCYEIVHGANEPWPNCPHKQTIKTKKPATAEFFEPHLEAS